jgi:hypothetical protein
MNNDKIHFISYTKKIKKSVEEKPEPVLLKQKEQTVQVIHSSSHSMQKQHSNVFEDENVSINFKENIFETTDIPTSRPLYFSISVKKDIIGSVKDICKDNYYIIVINNQFTLGKVEGGKEYECVKVYPFNNKNINLYSLLYDLKPTTREVCGRCNGYLYILITYYIIKLLISKRFIQPENNATFTLYDNALKTIVNNNKSIKRSNVKLSVEQLLKYSRTYYEAFGFLPYIMYTSLVANNPNNFQYISPVDRNYVKYFEFLVKKRVEFLDMKIKILLEKVFNENDNIYNFWKYDNIYITFADIHLLINLILDYKERQNMDNITLREFISSHLNNETKHELFYLPTNPTTPVVSKQTQRIYVPKKIRELIITIYKKNNIQIYEHYFHIVNLS